MKPGQVVAAAVGLAGAPVLGALIWDLAHLWDAIQAGAVLGTGAVVFWYTRETQRLRETAEAQSMHAGEQAAHALTLAEASGEQLRIAEEATQLQRASIAASYRPVLVAELRERKVVVTNIGRGPALGLYAAFRNAHSGVRLPMVPVLAESESVSLPMEDAGAEASDDIASAMLLFAIENQGGTDTPWPTIVLEYRDLAGTPHASVITFRKKGPGDVAEYGLHRNAQRRVLVATTPFAQAPQTIIDPIDASG